MCGIFSAITFDNPFNQSDKSKFDGALNALTHRGPDNGNSITINPKSDNESNFQIYLGHRRLSIIDLQESSNQPFESDGYQMIFNGEVFNYLELKKNLGEFQFKTNSDTEVVLRAYQKYGLECFSKFNGFWSIIIFDPKKNEVVISRDRFSIKPLYYLENEGRIYFSSEIKALKTLNFSLSPNHLVLEYFLNQKLIDAQAETFYNEIKRFPAMQCWSINLSTGKRIENPYWEYKAPEMARDYSGRKEQFRELLLDSLKLRLRSDVPLGTLLSGGLDSSAITTLIHKHLNDDIHSFSVVSDEEKYSEENFVDILVKEIGIKNKKLKFDQDLALENIKTVLHVQDEPYGSLSVVAQYLLFKQIKSETDITVLLSGQGADEVLLGYKKFFFLHLKELMRKRKYGKLLTTAGSSYLKGTTASEFSWKQAKRYLPGKTDSGTNFYKKELAKMPIWDYTNMTNRQIQDLDLYSVPALAHYEDRNSMAHQIEVRLPFLDYRLVNFLIHAPIEDKLKGGWTKYILRDAITELPEAIRWRKDKSGFTTPEEKWIQGGFGDKIIDYFTEGSRLEEEGLLDTNKFIDAVKGFKVNSKWLDYRDVFSVYISEMWLRENF